MAPKLPLWLAFKGLPVWFSYMAFLYGIPVWFSRMAFPYDLTVWLDSA